MGRLFVCATPIGNLEDITLRAIRTLKEADLIACEDTRHTKVLLDKHSITTPLTSYHKFNIASKTKFILSRIKGGKSVALVSDAGMPGISDPGAELIGEAIKEGIEVVPIPGPSAVITALAASGLPTDRFLFQGFLSSKKSERVKVLKRLKGEEATLVFYEAPHRIIETLEDLKEVFGGRKVVLAREVTKKFEEFIRGDLSAVILKMRAKKAKGEFVVIVEGSSAKKESSDVGLVTGMLRDLIASGLSKKDAVKFVAKYSGLPKNRIYDIALGK